MRRAGPWLRGAVALAPATLVLLAPRLIGLPSGLAPAAALVLMAIALWASGLLAEHVTALLLFALASLFGIAPPAVIFQGFASNAFWLVFGGLVIGVAVQRSGLGERLAQAAMRGLHGSYPRLVAGIVLFGTVLAFLVPAAVGRIVILVPIVRALALAQGFREGSPGYCGLMLAMSFGTIMPAAAILPANLPNLVLVGAAEQLYGVAPGYMLYLVLNFPVLGALKAVLLVALVLRLFPATPSGDGGVAPPPPPSAAERRLLALLLAALVLWATDVFHHIAPGWVALAAGVVCLLPGVGFLGGRAFATEVNFASLFYIAGLLGMVALIDASGLGAWLGEAVLAGLPLRPGADAWNLAALVAVASAVSGFTAIAGLPAVMVPLAGPVAQASGLPLLPVLMVPVITFSAPFLPYQVAPLAVSLQLGGVPLRAAVRLSLPLAALTLLLLAPAQYFWWRLLGFLH